MRVADEFVRAGEFWTPDNPDQRIHGTLKVPDGGEAELEVVGNFDSPRDQLDHMSVDRLLGHVEREGFVTLDNCLYTNKSFFSQGMNKSRLIVQRAVIGAHYEASEVVKANKFSFSVEGLDEWINRCGATVKTDYGNRSVRIDYRVPREIKIKLSDGIELTFGHTYTSPGAPIIREVAIRQSAFIGLISKEEKPVDDFISIAHKLLTLISIATDQAVNIRKVSFTSEDLKYGSDGKEFMRSAKLFYQSTLFSVKVPADLYAPLMLFELSTLKQIDRSIQSWLDLYDRVNPAINMYLLTRYDGRQTVERSFMSYVQALETYHRRSYADTEMEEGEFSELVQNVLSTCPVHRKKWLSGRLKYANEITLQKRLKALFNRFHGFFGDKKNIKGIIRKTIDARNYLTHFDAALKNKFPKGRELWAVSMKLDALFQFICLREIGFDDDEIRDVVARSYRLRQKLTV